MKEKSKFTIRLIFGVVIIAAVIVVSFKYLMKGSPVIKVLAVGLIVSTSYLVLDYLKRKNRN